MKLRSWYVYLAVLAFIIPLSAAVDMGSEGSFDRTQKVTGPVSLDVQTGSGSISLRKGQPGLVTIHARIRATGGWFSGVNAEEKVKRIVANPPVEQTGNAIRIGRIDDSELRNNVSISYEITAPAETRADLRTGSGSQTIDAVQGPVQAQTGSGNIRAFDIDTDGTFRSGSGNIELENIRRNLEASAGSGNIRAHNIGGSCKVSTGSGDVTLVQSGKGEVEAKAGSGTIRLENIKGSLRASTGSGRITADGEPSGTWEVRTGSGGISVRVPSNAAFDLYAHSSSSSINLGVPVTVEGTQNRHEVRGKVRGGGGFSLDLRSGSGDIEVR
jgi:DUF4097 and DUF4098 domain-containing protein YvlB